LSGLFLLKYKRIAPFAVSFAVDPIAFSVAIDTSLRRPAFVGFFHGSGGVEAAALSHSSLRFRPVTGRTKTLGVEHRQV
jgi:hypothetical protein